MIYRPYILARRWTPRSDSLGETVWSDVSRRSSTPSTLWLSSVTGCQHHADSIFHSCQGEGSEKDCGETRSAYTESQEQTSKTELSRVRGVSCFVIWHRHLTILLSELLNASYGAFWPGNDLEMTWEWPGNDLGMTWEWPGNDLSSSSLQW